MKLSHTKLIVISGLVWFVIGIYLLQLGLNLLLGSVQNPDTISQYPLLKTLIPYAGSIEVAIIALVVFALFIGYFKGRFVLGKSAQRGVDRIRSFSNPAPLHHIYSGKYYILLVGMVALGMSIKFMGLSNDIRGLVDTIIGSALINGAMIYFRLAQQSRAKA
ncbi:MAG TPA: hypothetical protein VGP47_08815 [Parachlamydiaceae bacterium]|nr:hypothetical protein [Parachlamydiaceae bacterium]